MSALGAFIECVSGCDAIPLYRLVELRLDDSARTRTGVPPALKRQTVTAAIYRVGALDSETGQPGGYALRLLVKPDRRRQRGSRGASLRSL